MYKVQFRRIRRQLYFQIFINLNFKKCICIPVRSFLLHCKKRQAKHVVGYFFLGIWYVKKGDDISFSRFHPDIQIRIILL